MPTHEDARLPAHAIAEINAAKGKDKKALIAWWKAWADVGDAKAAERQATDELTAAQQAYALCHAEHERTIGRSIPPGTCMHANERCARAVARAAAARGKARAAIDVAIESFKEG